MSGRAAMSALMCSMSAGEIDCLYGPNTSVVHAASASASRTVEMRVIDLTTIRRKHVSPISVVNQGGLRKIRTDHLVFVLAISTRAKPTMHRPGGAGYRITARVPISDRTNRFAIG